MQIRLHPPVYRFPFVYEGRGLHLGMYDVEIFTEGLERPTVVLRDMKENEGPSVTNIVEHICSKLAIDILPKINIEPHEVRWMECQNFSGEEQWVEVTFQGTTDEGFTNPKWSETSKLEFDWEGLLHQDPFVERTRRVIIDPGTISPEVHHFTQDECHRVKTGICSLDSDATPDESPGESGYNYCRDLAVLAQVWNAIRRYFGGNVCKTFDKQNINHELVSHVMNQFTPTYGHITDPVRDILDSVRIFGATNIGDPINGSEDDGVVYLGDGRHRTCVTCKLGIPVYALVSAMERNPLFQES